MISSRLQPSKSTIWSFTSSGWAPGRSILFRTGMISKSLPSARYRFDMVCASMPCEASTISKAPSQAAMERDTSYEKSTWPGVSIRFSVYFLPFLAGYCIWMAWLFMVMPRSRSRSISSSSWACICRLSTVEVNSSSRSARVDLPWSMWAIMQKLRMCCMD